MTDDSGVTAKQRAPESFLCLYAAKTGNEPLLRLLLKRCLKGFELLAGHKSTHVAQLGNTQHRRVRFSVADNRMITWLLYKSGYSRLVETLLLRGHLGMLPMLGKFRAAVLEVDRHHQRWPFLTMVDYGALLWRCAAADRPQSVLYLLRHCGKRISHLVPRLFACWTEKLRKADMAMSFALKCPAGEGELPPNCVLSLVDSRDLQALSFAKDLCDRVRRGVFVWA